MNGSFSTRVEKISAPTERNIGRQDSRHKKILGSRKMKSIFRKRDAVRNSARSEYN